MLIQSDPFREFDALIGRLAARTPSPSIGSLDAYRRGNDLWLHVDLPGVAADSLDVSVERGVLTLSGQRRWHREEGDQVLINERHAGEFRRQVQLSDAVDVEHIEADFHDGVLTLRIPLAPQALSRRIPVNGAQTVLEATTAA